MDHVQSAAGGLSGFAMAICIVIALYAFYQAYLAGTVTYKLYIYRDYSFSDPKLQAMADSAPRRSIWRNAILAFLYASLGFCFLLASLDYWRF